MSQYPLLADVQQVYTAIRRGNVYRNAGLEFDKYPPILISGDNGQEKDTGLHNVQNALRKCDRRLLDAHIIRWEEMVKASNAEIFYMTTQWRLLTGKGGGHPYESGFAFDRYGLPYLPGSGIKGLSQSVAFFEICELLLADVLNENPAHPYDLEKRKEQHRKRHAIINDLDAFLEAKAESFEEFWIKFSNRYASALQVKSTQQQIKELVKDYRFIFGTQTNAGQAIFFDAQVKNPVKIEFDTLVPHYAEYYSGQRKYATEEMQPRPFQYLVISAGVKFGFAVGCRSGEDDKVKEKAVKWIKTGLMHMGVGSKTGAGYGLFDIV